jgi:hypothetical protein
MACAAAADEPGTCKDRPTDRLLNSFYQALPESPTERLYEDTARLRKLMLLMPERIAMPRPADLAMPDLEAAGAPALTAQPGSGESSDPETSKPVWRRVVKEPVVERSRLAWVCYRAGRYADAAAVYRVMLAEDSDDQHARFMLFLCLRNLGERDAARKLHNELPDGAEVREWTSWTVQMDELVSGGQQAPRSPVGETNGTQTNATP